MAGCFGGSDIDRWMERNLDRYLDEGDPGNRSLLLRLFKGRKLIKEIWKDVSNEDGCYHVMKEVLVEIHTRQLKKYLDAMTSEPTLFSAPYKGPHTFYNPETCCHYYGSIDKDEQRRILEKWAMLPKTFRIENKEFNLLRMGKYSIVCSDTYQP
jgi:hypothetical protein